ncbi:hypothetical protein NKR19_g1056 [Coniochaeta hoffmannii]|uniref:Uncharacterized protein n=1 Tax=Coniochaeta hoffmannii TaxID=91930 RepID=A0AA38S1S1_9PEZI|nr:hypothetical protein NKR19_g1056 [Coniochaeta hoffmannii]
MPGSDDRQIAAEFLRGLVALVKELRDEAPAAAPAVIVSGTQATSQPARADDPAQSLRQTPVIPPLSESRVAAIQRARPPTTNDQQARHLDALERARQARLALKEQFEDAVTAASTSHPSMTPVTYDGQPQRAHSTHTATGPQRTPTPNVASPMHTAPWLIEVTQSGRTSLLLDGPTSDCTPGRLLYPTGKSGFAHLKEVVMSIDIPEAEARAPDIVIQRTRSNHTGLVALYHHLRDRKSALVNTWKRQNPTRAHQALPYEWKGGDPRLPVRPGHKHTSGLTAKFCEPGRDLDDEMEPGEIYGGAAVRCKLYFVRAEAAAGGTRYVRFADHELVDTIKRPATAIVLPETEILYSSLAKFVLDVDRNDWDVQVQPKSKKRPNGGEDAGAPPAKKAKKTKGNATQQMTTRSMAEREAALKFTADGPEQKKKKDNRDDMNAGYEHSQRESMDSCDPAEEVLTQTAVMVLLQDG